MTIPARVTLLALALTALTACSSGSGSAGGCPSGSLSCGGTCVDPRANATHCGFCGNACAGGLACVSGVCTATCPGGQVDCGGACVDPQTSAAHCGASGDCTGAQAGTSCAASQSCVAGACTPPICTPAALDLTTPFATDLPAWIASVPGQQAPTSLWTTPVAPLPTNTSWQNLVLGQGGNRVDFLPYQLKTEPVWLDVANAVPANFSNSAIEVSVPDMVQLRLGADEFGLGPTTHAVQGYDLFSVTVRYAAPAGTMVAPLVQGMPYVTLDYTNLQPLIQPAGDAVAATRTITSVNGSATTGNLAAGTRFQLALSDGTTWIVYASSPVIFNYASNKLYVTSKFTGTLRVANAPTPADVAVLDAHAAIIPRGGSLDVSVSCDTATLRFSYATTTLGTGTGTLLMAAMPHHMGRLVSPATTSLAFHTLRGALTGVEGSTWTMTLPLPTIGWTAPRPLAASRVAAVRAALLADASYAPDATAVSVDPYFGGKYLAKLARLALIADELGETATAVTLRARLAPLSAAWLEGTNGNPLVYDATWGGVVTTAGLANPSADFGQGHYSDHHFHYGYHLYAAAALARADPKFFTDHRAGLLALVRDIANPSGSDPRFPRFRAMDLFRGHSWASGLAENPWGRDQESSSEAVNAWYGLQLLGVATGDARMRDLGRLLLALELDSARTYWQVSSPSAIYQDPFAQNRCVGKLYESRATFDTFFGTEPYKVYGIQMLPYTPVSEALISPAWISNAWTTMQPVAAAAPPGWAGFLYMAHATIDPAAAWLEVSPLTGWDDGNSNTNTLWWVASRP
jgi:endo-1,3(4)-beta-glucanase